MAIKPFLKEFYLIVILVLINRHLFMKQYVLWRNKMTISHIPKQQNSAVLFWLFLLSAFRFSNVLLISSARVSPLRFSVAFWALKLVRLSLLVRQRHEIPLEKPHYLLVDRKCQYEALLISLFYFLISCRYIDSQFGIDFLLFRYKFIHRKKPKDFSFPEQKCLV